MTFFDYLKNFFFIILFLQITPPLLKNLQKQWGGYLSPQSQVGVIGIRGIIFDSDNYNKELNKYFKDPAIKAILLKVECPGSAAGTGQAIHDELQTLKKTYPKPVIALVENICASGGYYIASAADHIIAPGCAIVGSIGTAMPYFFKVRELLEKHNIYHVPLYAGKYKGMTSPFQDMTEEQKALLQDVLDDSYQQFAQDIAHNRKLPIKTVAQWGDGKIFSGRQAQKIGLIDELGSAANAVQVIKDKAIIEGEIEWVKPVEKRSFFQLLAGGTPDNDDTMFGLLTKHMQSIISNKIITQ